MQIGVRLCDPVIQEALVLLLKTLGHGTNANPPPQLKCDNTELLIVDQQLFSEELTPFHKPLSDQKTQVLVLTNTPSMSLDQISSDIDIKLMSYPISAEDLGAFLNSMENSTENSAIEQAGKAN